MMISRMDVDHITIWSRGKNRDYYGNPYYAYKCVIWLNPSRDHCKQKVEVNCSMDWGSSGKDDVFIAVRHKLQHEFSLEIDWNDLRGEKPFVVQHHKTAYKDAELEHPELWRVSK